MYNVGFCYFVGDGVAKDERRAADYWTMAADRNVAPAMVSHEIVSSTPLIIL